MGGVWRVSGFREASGAIARWPVRSSSPPWLPWVWPRGREYPEGRSFTASLPVSGHLEVTAVDLGVGIATAAHVPVGRANVHVLAKPIKDPTVTLSYLLPETQGGGRPTRRGYRSLDDLVLSEVADESDKAIQSAARAVLEPGPEASFTIRPRQRRIAAGGTGAFDVEISLSEPGTLNFAIQAICSDWESEESVDAENELDPLDDNLREVLVSSIHSVTWFDGGPIVFA